MLRHVDLCSGIGGFALGFQWAGLSVPVLFCDKDQFCQRVLAKHWPDVPVADDVKDLSSDPARLVPDCDIITAGYPCQPFSTAGKRKGEADDRHIWPFIAEIVAQKRPTFCVFENVYGHLSMGLDKVLFDLEAQNYSSRTFIVPACGVDAPHKRDRLWIIANTDNARQPANSRDWKNIGDKTRHNAGRLRQNVGDAEHDGSSAAAVSGKHGEDEAGRTQRQSATKQSEGASRPADHGFLGDTNCSQRERIITPTNERRRKQGSSPRCQDVADTDNEGSQGRLSGRQGAEWQGEHGHARCSGAAHRQPAKDWWAVEPAVGRVAHGIPNRVHRLKALGNAIVPQIAQQIGETIKAIHYGDH